MFSNFFPVDITYKNMQFSSSEQLCQYRRAEKAHDHSLALDILLAADPADCKNMSKHIPEDRNNDLQIMREVIALKFAKKTFRLELTNTGQSNLIECNPYDRFWSAGCRLDEKDSANFRGENKLGLILEEERDRILELNRKK